MRTILTITEQNANPHSPAPEPAVFTDRHAARAVVTNSQGMIALLHVAKYSYHKLPGGGVEAGEDIATALERELLEEIGCRAKVTGDLGQIIEYRNQWGLRQTSHCFTAKQIGKQKLPDFTPKEIEDGFEMLWVDDIDAAIHLLKNDKPKNYDGLFIQQRDLTFLEAAKNS